MGSTIVGADSKPFFAPANDPFVTASVLQSIVKDLEKHESLSNLYLCPVATKAQLIGFTLYYLKECQNLPVSIVFPFCESYAKETSTGLTRTWKYTIEL